MSRPRKPSKLKLIAGTDRPDRHAPEGIDLPLVDTVPVPPDWLPNAHAVKEWDRLTPILHANGLLTEASLSALGVLCSLHGDLVDQWSRRVSPTGNLVSQYRLLVAEFGLTPVSQGKVGAGGDKKKTNRFAGNGKPPEAKPRLANTKAAK